MSDTPSGRFTIANVAYPYRYASMSDDKQLVGQDNGNMVQVDVIDNVKGLVTIYDGSVGVYIGIDLKKNRVVGYEDPQVLQLSSAGDGYLIHPEDQDKVWVLDNDIKGTAITVEPAPDSNKKYWAFIPL
ncbi:hypothetical protein EV424DRAFT_1648274 [Suillus variegatus]|nr:hypothetical protein EV424DRAFT_1648617 [Suillus variegatus]KAG1798037.1 hypothetical protein EV424DRAFT_1648274 [Suillus variegatus]